MYKNGRSPSVFGEMPVLAAREVLDGMHDGGIDFVCALPESEFLTAQFAAMDDARFQFVPVSNEGIGIGICAGAWAGGRKPAMMMGATGFPLTTYPLVWLGFQRRIPTLLVITCRTFGDQHEIYGGATRVVEPVLRALDVPIKSVTKIADVRRAVADAAATCLAWLKPVAVVLSEEVIDGRVEAPAPGPGQ